MEEDSIRKYSFKGHKGSVLCLAHDSVSSLLLSGCEDETARLWDLRTSKTALCLLAGGEVTSVAFAPPSSPPPATLQPLPFARNNQVYLSVDNSVFVYDLRMVTAPIITKESRQTLLETTEEVNQISCSARGDVWVSAADDSGTVHLLHPESKRRRVLCHDSTNVAMAMSAVFRPKRRDEIASGGTDCTVHLWNVSKPRRPISSLVMERDDIGANQVCNPPMVHSLAWSPSGRLLAAGLGDGTIGILRMNGRNLTLATRLRQGHDSSVATVLFPNWSTAGNNHVLAQDRLLVTAGSTDGSILCFDLGKSIAGDGAVDPCSLFGKHVVPLESSMNQVSLSEDASRPSILFGIPHEKKVNWMVCSGNNDSVLAATFFVADTSNDITAYAIPMR